MTNHLITGERDMAHGPMSYTDAAGRTRTMRRFSADEDREIERMRIAGLSLAAVAVAVGRRKSSVQKRLDLLATRAEGA
jgi:hypothetical protein